MSLKTQTKHSLKWSSIEKLGQFTVQLIISIVLARILSAEDFGIIGILTIFILICNTLIDSGFSQGLIRKLDCQQKDYNSVFWFNLTVGVALYIFLYFAAPSIGEYFKNPELASLSRCLFLVIPLGSLNIIHITKMNKELNFKDVAFYTVIASVVSGVAGVTLAFLNFGVWSLVLQTLSNSILITLFIWFKSKWRPEIRFSFQPMQDILPFSSKIFASSFLNTLFNNLYTFIIAKSFSSVQLGYYSQANRFATQPTNLIDAILTRMTYPILATMQDDKKRYKEYYRILQLAIVAFTIPMMGLLLASSKEFIILVLGEKWLPSLPYFQLIVISAITFPLHPLCMSTLKVFGKAGVIFRLEIFKKVLMILLILLTFKYGIFALVCSQLVFFWFILPINMYYSGKEIGYSILSQLKDLYPFFILGFVCLITSTFLGQIIDNIYLRLTVQVLSFSSVYFFSIIFLDLKEVSAYARAHVQKIIGFKLVKI